MAAAVIALVDLGLSFATAIFVTDFIVTVAITMALSYALGAIFQPRTPGFESQHVQRMVKSAIVSRKVIYGEAKVSGAIVFHRVTKGTVIDPVRPKEVRYLHLVVAIAAHECDSIGDIQLNNVNITDPKFADPAIYDGQPALDLVRITKHLGTTPQTADAGLIAAFPGVWTTDHRLDGITYLYIVLASIDPPDKGYGGWVGGQTFWGGIPNVTAIVKGKKVHDVTSGSYPNDTPAWSDNWALCMADYLLDTEYGAARTHPVSLDVPAAISAKNISDETVQIFRVWDVATSWVVGDFVGWPNDTATGLAWKALVNNTNVQPPAAAYWIATSIPGFRRDVAAWSALAHYGIARRVEFGGAVYDSLKASFNVQPGTDPLIWQVKPLIPFELPIYDLWSVSVNYTKGYLIIRGVVVYDAYINNIGHDPALEDFSTWYPVSNLPMYQKRYTCNGVIDQAQTQDEIVSQMRTAAAGTVLYINGMYKIAAGAFDLPTITISENDLRGNITVQPRVGRRNLFDAVKGVFVDPRKSYQATDFPMIHNPMYQAEDYGYAYIGIYSTLTTYAKDAAVDTTTSKQDAIVWVSLQSGNLNNPLAEGVWWTEIKPIIRDIQLPFTTNVVEAQRIAKIFLERERQGIVTKLPMKMMAYQFNSGDSLMLSIDQLSWSGKQFRISGLDISDGIDLTLHEDVAASYDWNFGDYTLYDPNPETNLPPADVTDLVLQEIMQLAGSITSVVTASWTVPGDPLYVSANVYYRELGTTLWILAGNAVSSLQGEFLITGKTYQVQVNSVSTAGVESMTGPIAQITLDGGTIADISDPINPVLAVNFDAMRNVTDVSIQFDFDTASGTIPDGAAIFWQIMPNRNALTFGTDSGSSVDVAAIDVLDYIPAFDTVVAGSTTTDIIFTATVPAIPGLIGQYWIRVTGSQWRKASWLTGNTVHLTEALDITPTAGMDIDVAMISWVDDRILATHKLIYCNGEVFSWGQVVEAAGTFSLTGLQRGLEGTSQTTLTGLVGDYYPAQGGNTQMRLIPRAEAALTGNTVTWDGVATGVNVPLGSWASVTIALYKEIQNGVILRSNVVPFTVVVK